MAPWIAVALAACGSSPVVPGDVEVWEIAQRAELLVTVVDPSGAGVPGAWVVLDPGGRDAHADGDGIAAFPQLAPGEYLPRISLEGSTVRPVADPERVAVAEVDAAATVVVEVVPRAPELARLVGWAWDNAGNPLSGAQVLVDGADRGLSGADGSFAIEGLNPGEHAVELLPPAGAPLLAWSSPSVVFEAGKGALVSARLPGLAPPDAEWIGSERCADCHPDHASRFAGTAHARGARDPGAAEADIPALAAAVAAGDPVPLRNGGEVKVRAVAPGAWTAEVADARGASSGELDVVEVYGGLHAGAVLAARLESGPLVVLPVGWAHAGRGLGSRQAEEGWVELATDGWFDPNGALLPAPSPAASWDGQCAGCHATGFALSEPEPGEIALSGTRSVGCEACHGAGGAHAAAAGPAAILDPGLLPAWRRLEVCARCHEKVEDGTHPFSFDPGFAVSDAGEGLGVDARVAAEAEPAHQTWLAVDASRAPHDQVGDLRTSPHRSGPLGYDGDCADCHDPHGNGRPADLRLDVGDNALCTTCHAARFPDAASEQVHAAHRRFEPGRYGPGACTACHLPRSATVLRPDAVSGAGELRSHQLWPWRPEDSLAEFDAAGTDTLPLGQVPVGACLDCHLQNDAELDDQGKVCACPLGDPTRRITWVNQQVAYEALFGGTP